MFRIILFALCSFFIGIPTASALPVSFVLDQAQPGLAGGAPSLASNPTLDFDFDASGTNSASFSIHGYSSVFASAEVSYYATHVRYGSQSYKGMKVTFANPTSPLPIPNDGLPFLANIYKADFLIIGDLDTGGPNGSIPNNQDILDWIVRQTNPLRIAMDLDYNFGNNYGRLYGDFKPVLSSQIGSPIPSPEPSIVFLLASGLIGLLGVSRIKKA